jgi:hypothetical protein
VAEKKAMERANWARVYHAYFQEMVVKGLTSLAYRAFGPDVGFGVVADIVEKGSERGFRILLEELRKEGLDLASLDLREILDYEVKCHRYAVEKMGVEFQIFEEAREEEAGRRYSLYTRNCIYRDLAESNPLICALMAGQVSGILRGLGINARWITSPRRKKLLCLAQNRPDYIVYCDPETRLPECRVVIEKLECPPEG